MFLWREEKKKKKKGRFLFLEVLAAKLLSGRLCSDEQHTALGTAKKSFLTEQNVTIKPGLIRIPAPFTEKMPNFGQSVYCVYHLFCYHDPVMGGEMWHWA